MGIFDPDDQSEQPDQERTDRFEDFLDAMHDTRRVATPESLSPKARELYEHSVEMQGEKRSRIWLEYRDHYVLDDDMHAVEVPFAEWAVYFEGTKGQHERQIRRDHIGQWLISTVFLGLDHGYGMYDNNPNYKPILWETMIFYEPVLVSNRRMRLPRLNPATGVLSGPRFRSAPYPDSYQDRYRSTQDAIAGHEKAVALVQCIRKGPRMFKKLMRQKYGAQRSSTDRLRRRYRGLLQRYTLS